MNFLIVFLFYSSLCFAINPATPSLAEETNTEQHNYTQATQIEQKTQTSAQATQTTEPEPKTQPLTQLTQSEIEQKARDVVWMIMGSEGGGTAFAIAPKLFITNFHVVNKLFAKNSQDIKLSHSSGRSLSFKKIVKVDIRLDLALIETHEATEKYLTIPDKERDWDEDQSMEGLFMIAYLKGIPTKIEQVGKVQDFPYIYMFATNQPNFRGASGSPDFNKEGQFVGVTSKGYSNYAMIIKREYVSEFIHQSLNSLDCSTIDSSSCIQKGTEKLHALATQKSDMLAQFRLANRYDQAGNYEMAFYWAQQATNQKYAPAQHSLASMYYYAEGDLQNYEMAFYWAQQATNQKYAPAQYLLASMYYEAGIYEMAFYWEQQAANQKYAPAQYSLAIMYYEAGNYEMAFYWAQQASSLGLIKAKKILKDLLFIEGEESNYQEENYHGDTPLHHAARNKQTDKVKDLIAGGVDPNLKDDIGDTALHDAVRNGYTEIVKILIEGGADPNSQNIFFETPLHYAVKYEFTDTTQVLIDKGADPNLKDFHLFIMPY